MPTPDVTLTIVRVGLATQFAATLLLVLLFALLRSQAPRRRYFLYWSWSWILLAVGLAALCVRFFAVGGPLGVEFPQGNVERVLIGAYQFGKVGFLAGVLAGTLDYARGIRPSLMFRGGLTLAAVFALVCIRYVGSVPGAVVWQVPLTASCFLAAGMLLTRLPRSRRSLGSRFTGSCLLVFGVVWLFYALVFSADLLPLTVHFGSWFPKVGIFNALIDLVFQMLLAFGMVLILLEDSRRDTEAAHSELALAHQELKAESLRDSLTRALNRRAYNEGAGLEAARSDHGAVIVFDLDNLKDVNDTHGHQAGDRVLRYFVETLRPRMRPTDKLFRFGGDEFLLVMPRADGRRQSSATAGCWRRCRRWCSTNPRWSCDFGSAWARPRSREGRTWMRPSRAPTGKCTRRSASTSCLTARAKIQGKGKIAWERSPGGPPRL